MKEDFKRKEIHLPNNVIWMLQHLANKKGWSLKQYMENVLVKESSKFEKSQKQTIK